MKARIFSKGQGWYISASNYKDQNDKCYINLYFPKNTEPMYMDNGRGFSMKDIDIQEAKFTSYKGKAGLTVFSYTVIENTDKDNETNHSMFGAENKIGPNDLPFY